MRLASRAFPLIMTLHWMTYSWGESQIRGFEAHMYWKEKKENLKLGFIGFGKKSQILCNLISYILKKKTISLW